MRHALHARQELQLLERLRRERRRLRRLRGWRQVLSHRLCRRRLRRKLHGHRRVSHVRDRSDDDDDARADAQAQRQALLGWLSDAPLRVVVQQPPSAVVGAMRVEHAGLLRVHPVRPGQARRLPRELRWKLRQVLRGHHGYVPGTYGVWAAGNPQSDHPYRQGRLRAPQGQLQRNRRDLPASEASLAFLGLSATRRQKAATTRSSSRATATTSTSASPVSIRDPHPSSPRPRARGPTLASTLRARA